MSRTARSAPRGLVYHVLNRSVGKMKMFRRDADFDAFERIIVEAHERHPLRLLDYCIMPTHWHFVVWPEKEGEMTNFFRWLAHTHAMRWRVAHNTVGYGHFYQDRFKSFVVKRDNHFLTLCRYVERNALTAGLVERAEQWRYGGLYARAAQATATATATAAAAAAAAAAATASAPHPIGALLSEWPIHRPDNWTELVNRPMTQKELERVRLSMARGQPLGPDDWTRRTAARLNLQHTLRREGRPTKKKKSTPQGK
jgi:putative transposase